MAAIGANRSAQTVTPLPPTSLPVGAPGGPSTARADLASAIATLDAIVTASPADPTAAVRLAAALTRQAGISHNPGLIVRAEQLLRAALAAVPDHYEATRQLGTVLASRHRFDDALEYARRAQRLEPSDPWNYGVIADAQIELGNYDAGFAAIDEMMRRRPAAPAYARASYARELQGDLEGALRLMQMALDATSAHDPESQAWHRAQLGDLHFQSGRLDDADREYGHAAFIFPGHPLAVAGQARVEAARGNLTAALALYDGLDPAGTRPEIALRKGELYRLLGRPAEAERLLDLAEQGWRHDTPEPAHLARLLATRGRRIDEALVIAEREAARRRDIFTMDALAWAALKAGRIDTALAAARDALRTGTRDRGILYHAAAVHDAAGDRSRARALARQALDGHPAFDPVLAPLARTLVAGRT